MSNSIILGGRKGKGEASDKFFQFLKFFGKEDAESSCLKTVSGVIKDSSNLCNSTNEIYNRYDYHFINLYKEQFC